MLLHTYALLWQHAAVHVAHVSRVIVQAGEHLREQRLSDSTFLIILRGSGKLYLDRKEHRIDKASVCHAGKNTLLSISEVDQALEYMMLSYHADLKQAYSTDLGPTEASGDPFHLQFTVCPPATLPLYRKVDQMHRIWMSKDALAGFHIKTLFHQFLYELLLQLQEMGGEAAAPSLEDQAVRYLEQNYSESITIDDLAENLDCNVRQLQRIFKAQLSMSPMEYLIQVRLDRAKEFLQHTNIPLGQIADAVGYSDSYYFSRLFKKYIGLSPSRFRERARQLEACRQNPSWLTHSPIDAEFFHLYSEHVVDSNASNRNVQLDSIHLDPLQGQVCLTCVPNKIALLDIQYTDHLLSLGLKPAGSVSATSDVVRFPDYLEQRLRGVMNLGTKESPDIQAIAELAPDLIVCTQFQERYYEQLSVIAPTVMLDRNEDWRSTLLTLANLVGRQHKVTSIIQHYQHKIHKLRDALSTSMQGKSVALIRPRGYSIRLHTTVHRTAEILYRDLGIAAPTPAHETSRTSTFITLENMSKVNPDYLFVLKDDSNRVYAGELQQSVIWQSLRAVKTNQVYTVSTTKWIGYYGPIAMNQLVDEVAEALL
ncbi:AraC family transcriptional regulator [Paenibacillus hexagrammi]|uniref:AraC family transcriptional regulator n=1 Tax=Paenibacillus hexagrammi TaxID=2908839 RepID=A0ABY3SPW2_9BACL|nr:AraC family transcriptional regulator [Paenibacillus sp. YPD9-1]UJF36083.1 AraC family transcriptional regulator [Paenibacillus sp. YPD9-1]